MEITWDEPKRRANLFKHGLDFDTISITFFQGARILPARKGRLKAVGKIGTRIVVVIFAPLGKEGVSIVSMRPASPSERKLHG